MRIRTRRVQINRQQKHILLLALFLLKYKHGKAQPEKRHVLQFIDFKNLIAIRDEDRQEVSNGDEAWANDIAWRRADLKDEGSLSMPDHGLWAITAEGDSRLIEWVTIMYFFSETHSDWQTRLSDFEFFFDEQVVITADTVLSAREAYLIAKDRFPGQIHDVSDEVKGKLRL
jgi:hypothetical protein